MKKIFFIASLFFIPLLILAVVEFSLRLTSYGTDYPLFVQTQNTIKINPQYPQIFFSRFDPSSPELIEQEFPAQKDSNTIRIICLGGSTTAGFPFEVNISFPAFLKCMLQKSFPQKEWQIINLGISAVNSHGVRFMVSEVVKLKPDLVLIYMGHNEFYGVFGLASTRGSISNPHLVQWFLSLKKFRIYQLLEETIYHLWPRTKQAKTTLMARMIKNNRVPFNSPIFKKTIHNFKTNLSDILKTFKTYQIPVVLSPLVSNLKDQPPLGFPDSPDIISHFSEIKKAMEENQLDRAETLLKRVKIKALNNAQWHYLLAEVYYQQQEFKKAQKHYELSRDFDLIPFRAPSAINEEIRQLAKQYQAALTSTDSLFAKHSPHGIYDNTLFLEHLHPNEKGYFLMAEAFAQIVEKILFLKPRFNSNHTCHSFTELDIAIGELKIKQLIAHPPFNGRTRFEARQFRPALIHTLARQHNQKLLFWDAAHFQLGDYYLKQGDFIRALKEYKSVLFYDSTHLTALAKMGDVYFKTKSFALAIKFYKKATRLHPDVAFVKAKLAQVLVLSGNVQQALNVINHILINQSLLKQLSRQQRIELQYLQALSLVRIGRIEQAQRVLNTILRQAPNHGPARLLQKQLR